MWNIWQCCNWQRRDPRRQEPAVEAQVDETVHWLGIEQLLFDTCKRWINTVLPFLVVVDGSCRVMLQSLKYNLLSDLSWESKSWCCAALCQFHLPPPHYNIWSEIRFPVQSSKIQSEFLPPSRCFLLQPPCHLSQSQDKSLLSHPELHLSFAQLLQQMPWRHSLVSLFNHLQTNLCRLLNEVNPIHLTTCDSKFTLYASGVKSY